MMIVPFYVELASDDQRDTVERYISVAGARFVTGEKIGNYIHDSLRLFYKNLELCT